MESLPPGRLVGPALAVLFVAGTISACFTPTGGGSAPDVTFDGSMGFDGLGEEAGPDSQVEAGAADVTMDADASAPEGSVIDSASGQDAADSSPSEAGTTDSAMADTAMADTAMADVGLDAPSEAEPEAGIDATVEAAVEAGLDAQVEAQPDAAVEASVDASDAAVSCIVAVFGDHYVRTDGKAVYAAGGGHVVITDSASGNPIQPVTEIVQQTYSACALRGSDGTVWCWPISGILTNSNGELGDGVFGGSVPAVGSAVQVVSGTPDGGAGGALTGVRHLSTATDAVYESPTCAIASNRNVLCWGASTAQGSGPDGLYWGTTGSHASMPFAVAIAAGPAGSDGGAAPLVTADQISVGGRHACLLSAGQVSCWGDNILGNLGNGDPTYAFQPYPVPVLPGTLGYPATIDAVGAGYDFTCALAGGSIWCWGSSADQQIGDPSVPSSICGVNYCVPTPTPVQVDLSDGGSSQIADAGQDQNPLRGITSMIVGYQFGCGLAATGDIYCWGAIAAGSQTVPEARQYTSALQPYSGVTHLTAIGEDWSSLRYTTSGGDYVSTNSAYAPYCQ